MVRRVQVSAKDPKDLLTHKVAETDELGFRCIITHTTQGTQVQLNNNFFVTDANHWLDMDCEEFADRFKEEPDLIEDWFETTWSDMCEILQVTDNHLPNSGPITAAVTQAMLSAANAMTSVSAATTSATNAMTRMGGYVTSKPRKGFLNGV